MGWAYRKAQEGPQGTGELFDGLTAQMAALAQLAALTMELEGLYRSGAINRQWYLSRRPMTPETADAILHLQESVLHSREEFNRIDSEEIETAAEHFDVDADEVVEALRPRFREGSARAG